MIIFLIIFGIIMGLHYSIHIIGTFATKSGSDYRLGWATFFTFYRLFKEDKCLKREWGARFESDISFINVENTFMFNGILILLDPISFTIVKFYCWFKYLRNFIPKTDLLKSYNKVESEKIMDKLTKN